MILHVSGNGQYCHENESYFSSGEVVGFVCLLVRFCTEDLIKQCCVLNANSGTKGIEW